MGIIAKVQPAFRLSSSQSGGASVGNTIKGYFAAGGGWWDMEADMSDTSGNGNTLTEINIPTYVAGGKPGNYANLVAASDQYGTIADNAPLSMGAGIYMTCGGWVNLASAGILRRILSKGNVSTGTTVEYSLGFNNAGAFRFSAGDGAAVTNVTDTNVAVSIGTWYFVVARYKVDTGMIGINVNMAGWIEAAFTGPILNGTNAFRIGDDTGGARNWDGSLDSLFVHKSLTACLTDTQLTHIKNGTTGRSWSTL